MRLAVWSPRAAPLEHRGSVGLLPRARGTHGAGLRSARTEPGAARRECRPSDCAPPAPDLDLYQIGNSPAHAFVYRAALSEPGVVRPPRLEPAPALVLHETVETRRPGAYLREMRRAHGDAGHFVARQVARGLGGAFLPALFPLNDRLLEGSLGVVALTELDAPRAARRLGPGGPCLAPAPTTSRSPLDRRPSRAEARRRSGLPKDALSSSPPASPRPTKRLDVASRSRPRCVASPSLRLSGGRGRRPRLPLRAWARADGVEDSPASSPAAWTSRTSCATCAADVVLALRFPTHGEISGALSARWAPGARCSSPRAPPPRTSSRRGRGPRGSRAARGGRA